MNSMKNRFIIAALLLFCCAVASAQENTGRYDERQRPVIAPKGSWMLGGNASFSAHDNSNYSFAVANDINSVGFRIAAAPEFCWFFKNNVGVGVRAVYGRNMLSIGNAEAELGSTSLGIKDYYTVRQEFGGMIFLRYYIPVGDARRVAFHVDSGLLLKGGESKQTDEHTGNVAGTWQKSFKSSFEIDPGITVFLSPVVSLHATVGLFEISKVSDSQTHNQVGSGQAGSFNASFLPDITALNIGIDFLIGGSGK